MLKYNSIICKTKNKYSLELLKMLTSFFFIELSVEIVYICMKVPLALALHLEANENVEEKLIKHTKNLKTKNLTLQN